MSYFTSMAPRWVSAGLIGLMLTAGVAYGQEDESDMQGGKDIVETAKEAGQFETLVSAIEAADLVDTLKGEGPFTVFAPTDEAFSVLPDGAVDDLLRPENKEKLQAVLTYHVVPEKLMAEDVMAQDSAATVQGQELELSTDGHEVMVNDATVIKGNIEASNGIIHVIDGVLMPE